MLVPAIYVLQLGVTNQTILAMINVDELVWRLRQLEAPKVGCLDDRVLLIESRVLDGSPGFCAMHLDADLDVYDQAGVLGTGFLT